VAELDVPPSVRQDLPPGPATKLRTKGNGLISRTDAVSGTGSVPASQYGVDKAGGKKRRLQADQVTPLTPYTITPDYDDPAERSPRQRIGHFMDGFTKSFAPELTR
jgi:hypothetical protein